jgi:aflatoxin B1 aldehyde reductase
MVNGGHAPGAGGGDLSRASVLDSVKKSFERLGVDKVRTLYCHRPDHATPLAETAEVFDELYKQGKFEHWGVSNYRASTLKELLAVCDEKGFVKPTVYQGMYNVLSRHADTLLFPILKEHGITYNVYSPTAGGLFAAKTSSRYTTGKPGTANWIGMYKGDAKLEDAVEKIRQIADEHGISAIDLALRWAVHNSPLKKGDGVILGARNEEQLVQNVEAINKGKLPDRVAEKLDAIWESVKDVAPGDV